MIRQRFEIWRWYLDSWLCDRFGRPCRDCRRNIAEGLASLERGERVSSDWLFD